MSFEKELETLALLENGLISRRTAIERLGFVDSEEEVRRLEAEGRPIDTTTTREICQRCHRVSPVGFHSPDAYWIAIAGAQWKDSILCIICFAELGDEMHVAWETGLRFYPVSYATHHAGRSG